MGLSQALYSGVSGLVNHNRCMDNIGNNIANVNTVGFKRGSFQFSTILEQTYRGGTGANASAGRGSSNPIGLGLGTQTASITKIFTQGNFDTTNDPRHLAIDGNGFFALGVGNGVALTRDGNFYIGEYNVGNEKQSVLLATGGLPVLGYRANEYGVVSDSSPLESLRIEIGQVGGARETTSVSLSGNINADQDVSQGMRIVGTTMSNPPAWLGVKNLQTADSTWPVLEAGALTDTPTVINGGNVVTSGAMGCQAWKISQANLDRIALDPTVATSTMLEKVFISLDSALNSDDYAYFAIDSSLAESRDLTRVLNKVVENPAAPQLAAAPANGMDTKLSDLWYHDGSAWVQPYGDIQNGDEITISWQAGAASAGSVSEGAGTRTLSATFTYNNPSETPRTLDPTLSYTLNHFMTFLAGGVDDPTVVARQDRVHDAGMPEGVFAGFYYNASTGAATGQTPTGAQLYVDSQNRLVNANGEFINPDGDTQDANGVPYGEDYCFYGQGLYVSEENADWFVTDDGWRIDGDPASATYLHYLDEDGLAVPKPDVAGEYYVYGDATDTLLENGVQWLTVGLDPTFDASATGNQRLVGGAMGLVKVAPLISAANGGTDDYDAPAESAGAYTRVGYDQIAYNQGDELTDTFNLSLVSNLGIENALSNINVSYKNVTHTNMFRQDKDYYQAEGGGASTTIDVYDSLGTAHSVTLRLTMVAQDTNFTTWRWIADSASDTDAAWIADEDGNIRTNAFCGTGLIRFDASGQYVPTADYSETGGIEITREMNGTNNPIFLSLINGAAADFVQDLNFRALTQSDTGKPNAIAVKEQDGKAPGELKEYVVDSDGTIHGHYDNGTTQVLGRLALAMVANETGLSSSGSNLFYETAASGSVRITMAGTSGTGTIRQGQLEVSNVDLADEFTKLITTQRGYQANARTISTVDEMLQELLNLKR